MKYNIAEVASLQPDYLGFIFYDQSPRYFEGESLELPSEISKVGVFVDATLAEISNKIETHDLKVVQLHGNETANFCSELKNELQPEEVEIWKVFSIKDSFDFELIRPYEPIVDKFLFDTKGKNKGGNGYTFNWNVLKDYPSKKPFILSGGIGLMELAKLKQIFKTDLPIHAVDVNSKFEIEPGRKNMKELKIFKDEL